jgi:hypothetical protein
LAALMTLSPVVTSSPLMSICTHSVTREWLCRFSCNMVWISCHWCLDYNHTFKFPSVINTYIMDCQIHEVGPWLCHYSCSPTHAWWCQCL